MGEYAPRPDGEPSMGGPGDLCDEQGNSLNYDTAANVKPERVAYLWQDRIPVGAATIMPGVEGVGKTTVGIRLMADLTRGALPGEFYGTPRDVIIAAPEDSVASVIRPRLEAAGADMTRVHIVNHVDLPEGGARPVEVPRDLPLIGLLAQRSTAVLIWVDALAASLPDGLKTIAYKETATVLMRINKWAELAGLAVVAPWHLNKATGGDAATRMMDSRAFRTATRSVLMIAEDDQAPEGQTWGVLALDKLNAGTLHVPALRYAIRSSPFTIEETDPDTGRVRSYPSSCSVAEWVGEVEGDGRGYVRGLLAGGVEREAGPAEWLRSFLTTNGETPRADVIAAGEREGFSLAGIKRASSGLVHSRKVKGQRPNGMPFQEAVWSLVGAAPQSAHDPSYPEPTEPTEPTGQNAREGSSELIDPINAGQPQLAQSAQLVMGEPTGEPTGSSAARHLDEQMTDDLAARRFTARLKCEDCKTGIPSGKVRCRPCAAKARVRA